MFLSTRVPGPCIREGRSPLPTRREGSQEGGRRRREGEEEGTEKRGREQSCLQRRHSHLKSWLLRIQVVLDMLFHHTFYYILNFSKKRGSKKNSSSSAFQNPGDFSKQILGTLKGQKSNQSHWRGNNHPSQQWGNWSPRHRNCPLGRREAI